jgi:hypothetical protein
VRKSVRHSKPLVPTSNYVTHFDPARSHHRAWLQVVLDRLVALDPAATPLEKLVSSGGIGAAGQRPLNKQVLNLRWGRA